MFEAQAGDGVGETLAGQTVLPVEEDGLLHHGQDLVLAGEELAQRDALAHLLAPAAADADLPCLLTVAEDAEGALTGTAAAVVADIFVHDHLAVRHGRGLHGTALGDPALLTAPAGFQVHGLDPLADDGQVVDVGLDAVVGTAAGGDLELVGQLDVVIAQVEPLVDLRAEAEGVIEAVLAGGALAAHHGADLGAGTAGGQAVLPQECLKFGDLVIGDAGQLHGHAGGKLDLTAAEPVGGLGNGPDLLRGHIAVGGQNTGVEAVGPLVLQETHTLHALDIVGMDRHGDDLLSKYLH